MFALLIYDSGVLLTGEGGENNCLDDHDFSSLLHLVYMYPFRSRLAAVLQFEFYQNMRDPAMKMRSNEGAG